MDSMNSGFDFSLEPQSDSGFDFADSGFDLVGKPPTDSGFDTHHLGYYQGECNLEYDIVDCMFFHWN